MSSSYKLTYWDGRGLAEVSRLLFVVAGVSFEDHRLPVDAFPQQPEEWLALKPTTPFGQVPTLAYDDGKKVLAQSKAIERFLARRFGLLGANEDEAALIESVVEHLRDVRDAIRTVQNDPAKLNEHFEGKYVDALRHLERFSERYGSSGHCVGTTLGYADIALGYLLSTYDQDAAKKALAQFPRVVAIKDAFETNDKVAAYVKTRKVTPW